jgi:ferrous iron transport protein B
LGDGALDDDTPLKDRIRQEIPLPSAIAFIVVIMIYLPCLAATTVFAKEAGSWKYAFYLFVFTSVVAYVMAFIAYRVSLAVVGG